MTTPAEVALARAFVGVSYLLGARGTDLFARIPLEPVAERLARSLEASERQVRAREAASAVLTVSRDLDARRVG